MFPADTPEPPYYAVIFTSRRTSNDGGYEQMAARMMELAALQPGFLGVETARQASAGITVSYWQNHEAIASWKAQVEHLGAQRQGRVSWYREYSVRVCRVERAYAFRCDS